MNQHTTEQLFRMVIANPIWYEGYCDQNNAAVIMHRHKKGMLSTKKYEEIFNHAGYEKRLVWVIKEEA